MSRIVRPASGTQIELSHGAYSATIASVGAALQTLRFAGRDLVLSFPPEDPAIGYRGALLMPWPNRVVGGRWQWQGDTQQLAITEPSRGHALHGLVLWDDWRVGRRDAVAVSLTTTVAAQPGYPFTLDVGARWSLDDGGLAVELRIVNAGAAPAPLGCGIHPYLIAPSGTVDDWTLHLPADRALLVDEALVPTELVAVPDDLDFRVPRRLGGAIIDHAFTGIERTPSGSATVTLADDAGDGAYVSFDADSPWLQVCNSHWPGRPGHRAGVAVEPMTCPPNALASGEDLIWLAPGEEFGLTWRIGALAGGTAMSA